MNYKVLYRKYRPKDFSDVIGQSHIVQILMNSIANNKTSHAYIFTGVRGTGKTSIARVFAKSINCLNQKDGNACNTCDNCINFDNAPDVIEIDAASNNGVEEMREIVGNSRLVPTSMKYKIYIIDEVHMLSQSSFNALLKTLEEPVEHVKFILATTDVHKVPVTVLSRCQRYDFKKINVELIEQQLKNICEKEKIKYEENAIKEIAFLCDGSLRDALSMLDQISNIDKKISINQVNQAFGSPPKELIDEIILSIDDKNIESFINISKKITEENADINIIINKLISNYKNIIYNNVKEKDFDIDWYKKIIMTLLEIKTMLINTYDINMMFEVNILSLIINNVDEKTENKNINKEETKLKTPEKNPKSEKKESEVQKSEKKELETQESEIPETQITDEIKKIRINNCFAEANKELKQKSNKQWKNLLAYLKDTNLSIYSLLENSQLEVASEKNVIISLSQKNLVDMADLYLEIIEKEFNNINNSKIKICFLSRSEWERTKAEYISNRDKKKYIVMKEPKIIKNGTKAKNEALELFGADNIEVR